MLTPDGDLDVIDPRLPPAVGTDLADRLVSIAGRTILLVDNGKTRPEFGHLATVFEVLESQLRMAGADVGPRRAVDLLEADAGDVASLGAELATLADGVILGVADTGVSAGTVLLAAELERRSIPTVVVCQGIGENVASLMASQLAPGLPLPTLATWRLSDASELAGATRALWGEVVEGLTVNVPPPATSPSLRRPGPLCYPATLDVHMDFTAEMEADGYGDGFPLVAPSPPAVEQMLEAMAVEADAVVWPTIAPRPIPLRARDVAAVAVMAGCPPQVGSVVLEAYRAMAAPEFRLFQAAITTHPSGTLVLVSGPASSRVGMGRDFGAMGPGNRATATTGRAVALGYSFLLGVRPGRGDLSLQGSPAEFSYCVAENVMDSPWPGLHAHLGCGDRTSVTVLKCEGPHNILDNTSTTPESLLLSIADTAATLGGNNLYTNRGQTVVFLNPEHARIMSDRGWTRRDVQMFMFENARRRRDDLSGRGIATTRRPWMGETVPIVADPEDVLVVVVGAPGPQSQVAIPWGYSRGVTRVLPT